VRERKGKERKSEEGKKGERKMRNGIERKKESQNRIIERVSLVSSEAIIPYFSVTTSLFPTKTYIRVPL